MNETINVVMLLLIILAIGTLVCVRQSPDALDHIARKMRARARALRASKAAYDNAYNQSIQDDSMWDREREKMRSLIDS